jgi:hypothetical protein
MPGRSSAVAALMLCITVAVHASQAANDAQTPRAPATEDVTATRALHINGWVRSSLERPADSVVATLDAPHDDVVAREHAYVRGRFTLGRSFEAVGAGLFTLGAFGQADPPGERRPVRHDGQAELREAYVGLTLGAVDLRAGQQRIAWGHGDMFSPNDVLNAKDLRDPILAETELTHVPTPGLRADAGWSQGSVAIAIEPVFVADRYDVYGSNWALVQRGAPAGYLGALAYFASHDSTSGDDVGDALLVEPATPTGLSGTQAGVRADWRGSRVDVTAYYHYGYHGTPDFRIDPLLVAALDATDWTDPSPTALAPIVAALSGSGAIGSTWERRHHVGLDLGTTAGPFVMRLDTAYESPALFYDRSFNGWLSPAVEAVAGLEYQTGQLGRLLVVEGRVRRIRDDLPRGGLLYVERTSADLAVLGRWSLGRFEAETRAVVGLTPSSIVLRPQAAWKTRGYAIRAGLLILGGDDHAFGGWYRRNQGGYLMIRKDF